MFKKTLVQWYIMVYNKVMAKNNNGYVMILSKDHPNCDQQGYVREHRLIMEKHLGRYLTSDEVVHHKNHIRNDNRLSNLEVLSKTDHDRKHLLGKNNPFYGKHHKPETLAKLREYSATRKIKRDNAGRILGWSRD